MGRVRVGFLPTRTAAAIAAIGLVLKRTSTYQGQCPLSGQGVSFLAHRPGPPPNILATRAFSQSINETMDDEVALPWGNVQETRNKG